MKWYPMRFVRNMVLLAVVVAIIVAMAALFVRASEVSDCQNYRNPSMQTFDHCMQERYGK
jgi:uncharacterized membrane protein